MQNNFLQLDYIINANNFQKLQDTMADATEMAMLTVDYKGIPITTHSRCSDFCRKVRSNPAYSELCNKCDARGGLEATRLQKPYVYICHMGLLDFAVPLIVGDQYIGAILAGQVLIGDEAEKESLEKIVTRKHTKLDLTDEAELQVLYEKLSVMTLDRVEAVANMVFQISNYVVEEALLKINLNEMNHQLLTRSSINSVTDNAEPKSITETYKYYEIDSSKGKVEEKVESVEPDNIILRPALEFIQNNYNMVINLDDMASLCNISSSYFSKLFKKSIGDNFANYINKIRIQKAKELLKTTNTPILNIAIDLGFDDCGYFIKVFKKLEGLTPSVYRRVFTSTPI